MKKGLSSLIATVLLVGFTIVLAAIVFVWTSDFLKEDDRTSSCANELQRLCASSEIKFNNVLVNQTGAIFIELENIGNYEIVSTRLVISLNNDTTLATFINYSTPLLPFYPINFTLNFVMDPNLYEEINAMPIIRTSFESNFCETVCSAEFNYKFKV